MTEISLMVEKSIARDGINGFFVEFSWQRSYQIRAATIRVFTFEFNSMACLFSEVVVVFFIIIFILCAHTIPNNGLVAAAFAAVYRIYIVISHWVGCTAAAAQYCDSVIECHSRTKSIHTQTLDMFSSLEFCSRFDMFIVYISLANM